MAGRNSHFSNASVFFSLLTAAIILLLLPTRYTSRVSLFFYDAFESVLRIGRDAQLNTLHPQSNQPESISYSEYARLWKNFKNLEAQLFALRNEHERLAKVRLNLPQLSSGVVMARIISNYGHEVIINKGHTSFIQPGQYVLSEEKNALIGVVSEASETAARVRLVTDAMQSVEVRIRREGTDKNIGAMMIGSGTNECRISMIEQQQDVREGDTVYAAAVPNKLDIPVVAGEVVQVRPDDLHPLLWDITVMPAEDLTRLNDVAVIVADETFLKRTK